MKTDQAVLRLILSRADHPDVKIFVSAESGHVPDWASQRKISVVEARQLLERGHFAWSGSPRRVRKMWPTKPPVTWHTCYRTAEAPVLQPSIEYVRECGGGR